MKVRNFFIIILLLISGIIINCREQPYDEEEQEEFKITKIVFGNGFQSDTIIRGIDTIFPSSTNKIYYKIVLKESLMEARKIKKIWKRDNQVILSAVSFVLPSCKKIYGEFHYYADTTLDEGKYEISVYYYDYFSGEYKEFGYESGVKRSFRIKSFSYKMR
ncbi:MAG: hypothetical protein ABIM29_03590 [candidate division WOR-3 bacterium]